MVVAVVAVVLVVHELRTDLAAWAAYRVDVDVRRPRTDGSNQLIELAGGESLSGGSGADVRRPDRPRDCSAGRGARLRPRRAVAQIRAEEHDDRADVRLVLEVDVGLRRRRLEA